MTDRDLIAPVFNSGLAYLERINDSLKLATQYSLTSELWLWAACIKALYRDVYYYLNDEQRKSFEIRFKLLSVSPVRHFDNKRDELLHYASFDKLNALDRDMRLAIHENSLLMPNKDNPGAAIFD